MIRLALALLLALAGNAWSQDIMDRGAWFESLKQPTTGMSCCSIADCRATQAEWRGNRWYAIVMGDWVPIPDDRVLHDKPSIDGDAYVCHGPGGTIYCFVPPSMAF